MKNAKIGYALVLPTVFLLLLIIVYPLVYSFIISLTNSAFTRLDSYSFVGLENYRELLRDDFFVKSVILTLYFVVVSIFIELVLGMVMALVLNTGLKGCGLARAFLVLPWALPGTVTAGIWRFMFQIDYGFVNGLLRLLGYDSSIGWLSSDNLAMNSVIFAEVWRMTPFFALLLLSGLSTISDDLYEAARVDGANEWHIFWRVTLPLLKPIIGIILVIRTIFTFQNLEMVYVMTRGGPGISTYLTPYYLYREGFVNMRIGNASAISYYIVVLIVLFCVFYVSFLIRRDRESVG